MRDLRLAVRALRATPIISAVAVLSLALGIGANTAIFSLINAIALKPLAAPHPERLAVLTKQDGAWTRAEWAAMRDRQMFDRAAAWSRAPLNISPRGQVDLVDGLWASGELFDLMGIQAAYGRNLLPADDRPGGGPEGPAAIISQRFWQQRYAGAPDAIGRSLTIGRIRYTIVGIAPRSFVGMDPGFPADIILPLESKGAEFLGGGATWVTIFARLKPAQTFDTATAELRAAQAQIAGAEPLRAAREQALRDVLTVKPAAGRNTYLKEHYEQSLFVLLAIVGLVLLVACANIATLLTARVLSRKPEFAVRVALGASRIRLARQLLMESFLLAALGVGGGVVLATWSGPFLLRQLSTEQSTVFLELAPDWRVLGFAAAIGAATVVFFGVSPALRASRAEPIDVLKQGARTVVGGRFGFGSSLVGVQVAFSLVLLVAAGLFVRSFINLAGKDVGFDREPILVVSLDAANSPVAPTDLSALGLRVLDAARSVPGVEAAGASVNLPGGDWVGTPQLELGDGTALPAGFDGVLSNSVGPGWFETLGLAIVAGRSYEPRDITAADAHGVVIVNETFARRFLKGNPVGQTVWTLDFKSLDLPPTRVPLEIVGVARDAMYIFVRDAAPPTVYFPMREDSLYQLSVRAAGVPPLALKSKLTEAIGRVDPNLLLTFRTLADRVSAQYAQERLTAVLSGFFGALALLLAGLGLYGVTSYAVAQRRGEIGLRMALGAEPAGVVWLVMKRVSVPVGAGIVGGAIVSLWAATFAESLLYGVAPRDLATVIGASATLACVGALAGWLPARRASRLDPAEILRE